MLASCRETNDSTPTKRTTSLTLPPNLLLHKTLMIALVVLARRIAVVLEVDLQTPVAELCRAADANRTSVYQQTERILSQLEALALARAGRPAEQACAAPTAEPSALSLTVKVLEFQLDHPGCVLPQRGRTSYSPAFQRFVLAERGSWPGSLEAFAQAVRVSLDTLAEWLRKDRRDALAEPVAKQLPPLPVDASDLTRTIAAAWQRWDGPVRPFIRHAARSFRIAANQVARVLMLLGVISRRRRRPFRHRGSTSDLSPGAMLVTDGKEVEVVLTSSGEVVHLNWQAMVDQATGCDTAAVVTDEECAAGVAEAFQRSLVTLGNAPPQALLHDNKPCYDDAALKRSVNQAGTTTIPATFSRAENKAVLEGAFGLFEQRVGSIRLNDESRESLVRSAVEETLRAYVAATNSVPRPDLHGRSRLEVLHDSCPSLEQQERDRAFLARLKADHESSHRWLNAPDPTSLELLNVVFDRLGLLPLDPTSSLRRYLAAYEPAAIRRAAAVVAAKLNRGALKPRFAHRYLTKVIQNQQDELDLERASQELLHLATLHRQSWTTHEELDYRELLTQHQDPEKLVTALADNAAQGGLPVRSAFWTDKLLTTLRAAPQLVAAVVTFLVRLYEAPAQNRLALVDLVTAASLGLA